ncbi:MAG: ASCH domain-containing protein [Dehalococcoidia bacterium]
MALLFRPEHVEPILQGVKTETRRLWQRPRVRVGAVHRAKLRMLSPDHFALLRITGLRQERLRQISDEDAGWEGGYTRETFLDKWFEIHPRSPDDPPVWVVEFAVAGRPDAD